MKLLIAFFVTCVIASFGVMSASRSIEVSANTHDPDITAPAQPAALATCWGQRECCEWYEDENGNDTGRCRVWSVCFGGAWTCP